MGLYAMITGLTRQLQWLAGSLAFLLMVSYSYSTIERFLSIVIAYVGAIGLTNGQFAESDNPFAINFINCNGTEEKVVDCSRNENELASCGRFEDAGIVCQGTCYSGWLFRYGVSSCWKQVFFIAGTEIYILTYSK